MIRKIKHRGLKRLYESDNARGVYISQYVSKINRILFALDHADYIEDLNLPGFRIHSLSGDLKGFWSITVSGNWRIIFHFENGDVFEVDLVDYH